MLLPMAFPAVGPDPEYLRLGQHDRVNFRVIVKSRCAECLSLSWTSRYEVCPASPYFPGCPSISVYGLLCPQKAHQQQPTALCSWLLALQHPIFFLQHEWLWLTMTSLSLCILNKHMASRLANAACCLVALGTTDHSAASAPGVNPADPSQVAKLMLKAFFPSIPSQTVKVDGVLLSKQHYIHSIA